MTVVYGVLLFMGTVILKNSCEINEIGIKHRTGDPAGSPNGSFCALRCGVGDRFFLG
jgi:hypothetical protein